MSSSLSSVVSNLVRAQMGASLAPTVTDEDLDRHVAELILKEAKKKAERYGQQGIRAYITNNNIDSNAPRPNKRFLTSIIKSTDDHNKTVLKAQALAAQEIKQQRIDQEKRERRKRALEAVEAEKLRRSGRRASHNKRRRCGADEDDNAADDDDDEGWDRWDGRTAERQRKVRDWATWKGGDGSADEVEGSSSNWRRRSRRYSRSRSRSASSHSRSPSRERDVRKRASRRTHDEAASDRRHHYRDRDRSRSPRGRRTDDRRYDDSEERAHAHGQRHKRSRRDERRRHRSEASRSPSTSSRTARSESPRRQREPAAKYALDDLSDEPLPRRRSLSPLPPSRDSRDRDHDPPKSDIKEKGKEKSSAMVPRIAPQHPYPHPSSSSKRPRSPSPAPPEPSGSKRSKPNHAKAKSPRRRPPSRSRSPTPGPESPVQLPSKMDKYFEESYDPRLDVAPLSAPTVPKTGLINNAEYDGWDAMLELVRLRQQDREDRKVMEKLGLLPKDKDKKSSKKAAGAAAAAFPTSSSAAAAAVASRWGSETANIMEIEYKKKGAVREWDLGKEGF